MPLNFNIISPPLRFLNHQTFEMTIIPERDINSTPGCLGQITPKFENIVYIFIIYLFISTSKLLRRS